MLANKRKALTLLEVLISIFIMGIGMLSVLALFPAAADMMSRAIKNYQTAEALINAAAINDGVDFYSSYKSLMTLAPDTGAPPFDVAWDRPATELNVSATATATLNSDPGSVSNVTLTSPGWGYSSPIVSFSGGAGTGAIAKAVVGTGSQAGRIISINLLNGGSNYSSPVTVTISEDFPRYLFIDQYLCVGIPRPLPPTAPTYFKFGNAPVCYIAGAGIVDKFFTLNSDLPIDDFGRAEQPAESLGNFTISYLLEKPKPVATPNFTRRYALVFKDRRLSDNDKGQPDHRDRYEVTSDFQTSPSSILITGAAAGTFSTRKWLMVTVEDSSIFPVTIRPPPRHVRFVEIRSINEVTNPTSGGVDTYLEISPPLIQDVNSVYRLRDVLWVAYLGV